MSSYIYEWTCRSISLILRLLQAAQPPRGFPATGSPTAPIVRLTKTMIRRSSKLCFRPKKATRFFTKSACSNSFLITHISFSVLGVSLDLDSLLSLLLPPKHTAVDSYLPRKFVSSQTEAGHASAARPSQTLQVSAPREICASIQRLDLPALHFRTRADMPWPLSAAPNQHVPRSVTVSKIISYRVHAIAAACQSFERPSRCLPHGFRITGPLRCLQSSPAIRLNFRNPRSGRCMTGSAAYRG